MRASGILLSITSLPSNYGIGTLGQEAYRFVDFLKETRQHYWQILPLGPTGFGDSPYQTFSSFAGNPYLIDLDLLIQQGLLKRKEVTAINWGKNPRKVDYGKIYRNREKVLRLAYERGWTKSQRAIKQFQKANEDWLPNYALYRALKKRYKGKPWYQWPEEVRLVFLSDQVEQKLQVLHQEYQEEEQVEIYIQFLFDQQWKALRAYAKKKDIAFIGDVPIYVPLDSSDVWSEPGFFELDAKLQPKEVAGVPPDGFSANGQLWGNPLYNWKAMKKDGYGWWIHRLKGAAKLFDVVRIDHFRGLASFYAVKAKEKTARRGVWRKGPGIPFIRAIKKACPEISFIAEDLGYHTNEVQALLDYSGFPGMKVLEFAFDTREPSDYLPHNYPNNCVCYTGTHDNATAKEWFQAINPSDYEYAKNYMGLNRQEGFVFGLLRNGMGSDANLFIAQLQDWLLLGKQARMNIPGTLGGNNWRWRFTKQDLKAPLKKKIAYMTNIYGRDIR